MTLVDVIAHKRDGLKHTREEIDFIAQAAAGRHEAADYQLSAWLMAAYLRGLDEEETLWLTQAMAASGERLDLSSLPKPWLDKHSTGGVGDKTSLVVLPVLAACGLTIVKMSGRGLGITGGTIDKLESIPGFLTDLGPQQLLEQAQEIGLAITGQSPHLAPADKTLYCLRDTTGTVDSLPLIVSSILSKKLAGGADHILMDVKCGSGGFMPTLEAARKLANVLKRIAKAAGLQIRLAITEMNQPLGSAVGNAVEVREAIATLQGKPGRFRDLCVGLANGALELCGQPKGAAHALDSGLAWGKWRQWISHQTEGQMDGEEVASNLREARNVQTFAWEGKAGWISKIDARAAGELTVSLGGGRVRKDDPIDHSVGLEFHVELGSEVAPGNPLVTVHSRDPITMDFVARIFSVSTGYIEPEKPILEWL